MLAEFVARTEQGDLTEISAVRLALEQQIDQEVAKSTVYRLLERHGWRKIQLKELFEGVHPQYVKYDY